METAGNADRARNNNQGIDDILEIWQNTHFHIFTEEVIYASMNVKRRPVRAAFFHALLEIEMIRVRADAFVAVERVDFSHIIFAKCKVDFCV